MRVAIAATLLGGTAAPGAADASSTSAASARAPGMGALVARPASLSDAEAAELRRDDRGLYIAFCPQGHPAAILASASPTGSPLASAGVSPMASIAEANHDGWPADQCLKMDKGPVGLSHTLLGIRDVHNWLLGGYGNDTFYAGEEGDVIWGDYHPEGQPESQSDYIHGGAGADWIYASHGFNEIWTGAGDDHLALVYGHGVVHCNGPGVKTFVMRYLPQNRPWTLLGCSHKVLVRYRA